MSLPNRVSAVPVPSVLVLAVALGNAMLSVPASAQPASYTTPNVTTAAGPVSVSVGGQTVVNHGLQGVARMSATATVDFRGDTFGAFSGMDMIPGSWRKTSTGYTGTLVALPDRGPNGVGSITLSDYPARLNNLNLTFTPYTGTANLPVSSASQQQMVLTQAGGVLLRDFNGQVTTGLDPGTGATAFVTQSGKMLPGSTTGPAAGKISIDAEGLRFLRNGNFYVSDEYGANVYYFDKSGSMLGVIQPPPALVPRAADGTLSFTSQTDAVTGRRVNQGLEGLALTPDNKKLVSLLQSATMQDSTSAQQTRTNTRLMIYDISQNATPSAPVGHYVLQLPVLTTTGNGGPVNRTAAQSELLALNDTQFLVLSRDGNGLGQALLNPVYKSVLLIDTAGATNLAGTTYETSTTPVSPGGVLNSTIKPVSQAEVVNILNTTQLGKFGLNIVNTTPTRLTLTEKLEGMVLMPVLDENAPQDYFLMVGNDNDFLSSNCRVGGLDCAQSVDSDGLVLVYRLTLPSYVEPQHLQSMTAAAPTMMGMTSLAAREVALASNDRIIQHLAILRHSAVGQNPNTLAPWLAVNATSRSGSDETPKTESRSITLGLDSPLHENLTVGATAAWLEGDADSGAGFTESYDSWQLSAYGAWRNANLYVTAAATYGDLGFNDINRPAAYGVFGSGSTDGDSLALTAEVGYLMERENVLFGPLAGFRWMDASIDGYTETGASGGNVAYPDMDTDDLTAFLGGEASIMWSGMRAIGRLTYNTEGDDDSTQVSLTLPAVAHAMGRQSVVVSTPTQGYTEASVILAGLETDPFQWWLNLGARIGDEDGSEYRVMAGFRLAL